MIPKRIRPGPGWSELSSVVWEHIGGARIHLLGLVRMPDKSYRDANCMPQYFEASQFIKINGGNRKRGLMAWAMKLVSDHP